MLKLLTKFLDILPSVTATVLAAWIITHFINPKGADEPKAPAKAEVTEAAPKAPLNGASGMSLRAVETVAVKPAAEDAVETKRPAREKAATALQPKDSSKDSSKDQAKDQIKPPTREAKAVPVAPVVSAPPRVDDRKVEESKVEERKATDLARAALDRLRQDTPEPARAAVAPVLAPVLGAPPSVLTAPAPALAATPVPAATAPVANAVPPALPPPVVISAPRDIQPVVERSAPADSSRPVPPAEIPARMEGMAADPATSEREGDNPSLFGGLKSAAKSLVETVIPR